VRLRSAAWRRSSARYWRIAWGCSAFHAGGVIADQFVSPSRVLRNTSSRCEVTEDAAFSEIQEAFFGNTPIEFAIMSGPMTDPDSEGLRATCDIFNFTRNEALEEAIMVDVTIKPTYAANAPEWISGTAP